MADLTRRLPIETLASTLSYLSESDLRRTTRVSRRWRAIALAHCDLCIRFHFIHTISKRGKFSDLQAAVAYVCSQRLRFDLTVNCYTSLATAERSSLAKCLTESLAQLVKLSVRFFTPIPEAIYGALRHPARHLRQLHITANGGYSSTPISAEPLPFDLLALEAPDLQSLELINISLPHRVAAFGNTQRVALRWQSSSIVPRINVRTALPSVLDLTIECQGNVIERASPVFDLRGLALTRLTTEIDSGNFEINDVLLSEIDEQLDACSPAVPVVRRYCMSGLWGDPAWHTDTETLNMRVHANCDWTEAAVVTTKSRLYRIHWFNYSDETEWDMGQPLEELSFLADRLVYVRIQNHFLPGFLQFRCNMPVLRRLQLDLEGFRNMVWPPYHNDMCYMADLDDVDRLSTTFDEGAKDHHRLPCPALDELVITSHERGRTADSREAAHLGLALEQDVRPHEKRARLLLRGVAWAGPVLDELLTLVFSTVVVSPFTKDDPDGSLWDPCFD